MDYMDHDVCCPKKAVKLNLLTHSPTGLLSTIRCQMNIYYSMKLLGGILVLLHPSVRPAFCVRSVAPRVLVGYEMHFIFIHLIKQHQKVWQNLNFWHFFRICNFDYLLLIRDLMWITSMGNHGVAGGFSERRRSSCSSWYLTKWMWVDRMLNPLHDLELWPWPWIFKVKFLNVLISGTGGPIDMVWKGCELIGC